MCLKDYDKLARLRVLEWRLQHPDLKEPTIAHLAVVLSSVPKRKREQFGALFRFYVRQSY